MEALDIAVTVCGIFSPGTQRLPNPVVEYISQLRLQTGEVFVEIWPISVNGSWKSGPEVCEYCIGNRETICQRYLLLAHSRG